MAGTCEQAASVARGCAQHPNSQEWQKLSSMMCWDAVVHCALLAGIVNEQQYRSLLTRAKTLVGTGNSAVNNSAGMAGVPQGHFLAFFANQNGMWTMIHAMVSTGAGNAAGNKNDCIGIGRMFGWELLNLQTVKWGTDGFTAPRGTDPRTGQPVYREIHVHHRPMTDLAFL